MGEIDNFVEFKIYCHFNKLISSRFKFFSLSVTLFFKRYFSHTGVNLSLLLQSGKYVLSLILNRTCGSETNKQFIAFCR